MEPAYAYVEERDDRYYLRSQRIPVYSIAYAWNQGRSPETISQDFPVLTLAEVYGAITFYLDHREIVDRQQAEDTAIYEAARAAQQSTTAAKMAELRQRLMSIKAQREDSAS